MFSLFTRVGARHERCVEGPEVIEARPSPSVSVVAVEVAVPWDGRSPRSLTKAYERFSLASEGTGRVNPDAPGEQLEMFPEGTLYGT